MTRNETPIENTESATITREAKTTSARVGRAASSRVKREEKESLMQNLNLPFRRPEAMHRVSNSNLREKRKDTAMAQHAGPSRTIDNETVEPRWTHAWTQMSKTGEETPTKTYITSAKSNGVRPEDRSEHFPLPSHLDLKSYLQNQLDSLKHSHRSNDISHDRWAPIIPKWNRVCSSSQSEPETAGEVAHPCTTPIVSRQKPYMCSPIGNTAKDAASFLSQQLSELALLDESTIASRGSHTSTEKELGSNGMEKSIQGLEASPFAAPLDPFAAPTQSLDPEHYAQPFCDFLTKNPTVFHAVDEIKHVLRSFKYTALSERDAWNLKKGGRYYVDRNGSSVIAFTVGDDYEAGNGAAILAGHVDALTAKLKPVSRLQNKVGYVQLGVAPYAGALNSTWWDRDLGVAGRVLVKTSSGKIESRLVNLSKPIARIPTLAPHFGAAAAGPFNKETQMVPIIGLDNSDIGHEFSSNASYSANNSEPKLQSSILGGGVRSFASTQPPRLVRAVTKELGIKAEDIINWELELYDPQPATLGGLDDEFIFGGRIDDKLCSWAAVQALLQTTTASSGIVKVVGLFDDEEIGSLLRQGANSNFLPDVLTRISESFASPATSTATTYSRMCANSFLVSSDVTHAVNPNFLSAYLENHAPRLNVGLVVAADSNGHMTTDAVSTAILQRCAELSDSVLQVFQIRNDSRSGGTVGPMLSAKTGIRAIDAGLAQLSMHSIRATTGSLDPGLGVKAFQGFLDHFEKVDAEFRGIS